MKFDAKLHETLTGKKTTQPAPEDNKAKFNVKLHETIMRSYTKR